MYDRRDQEHFAVWLSSKLLMRLRLEAVRRGTTIRSLVSEALDSYLPKEIEVVIGKRRNERSSSRNDRPAA